MIYRLSVFAREEGNRCGFLSLEDVVSDAIPDDVIELPHQVFRVSIRLTVLPSYFAGLLFHRARAAFWAISVRRLGSDSSPASDHPCVLGPRRTSRLLGGAARWNAPRVAGSDVGETRGSGPAALLTGLAS